MVQAAPPRTLQSFDGLIMAKVCSPEHGCVLTQVMAHVRIDDDGSWFAAYWAPDNPLHNVQASGVDPCEAAAVSRMLAAISSLAPVGDG